MSTKKISTVVFGKHLTIDAYGCNATTLNSMEICFQVLSKLPAKIAMRPIMTPYVIRVEGNNKKDCGGISGFVMIAESHIALHTFPAKQYLTMDVYSCSMFDEKIALKFVKEIFDYQSLEKCIIKRGLKFPKDNLVDI
ncbi:MAG: S-adenosylmethionine decarboxylase [Candidatus Gribaldobacteria bacterium]|nr:S-adenosylmethionine decarboxylase [Candidatus Gribaldobacteria bacterium]